MIAVGETLRRERLKQNLDLDHISQELKISSRFLEAIEEEKFDQLPGSIFAKSFVRQYARLLGLDEEELMGEVKRALDPPPSLNAPPAEPQIRPVAEEIHLPRVEEWAGPQDRSMNISSWLPALVMVVAVMLICSVVYSWWQRERRQVAAHPSVVAAQTPPQTAATEPAPITPPAAEAQPAATPAPQEQPAQQPPQPAASTPSAAVKPAPNPEQPPATTAAAKPAANQTPLVETPPDQPAKPPAADADTAPATIHLQLTADEPVWVLARSNGKYLFSGTLDPNETRNLDGSGTILVRLGNAGGVSIVYNGKPIGALGPRGQVRTVQFTSGGFQIVAAPKPAAPDPLR
jgi:cytoskeleton protein RodZ